MKCRLRLQRESHHLIYDAELSAKPQLNYPDGIVTGGIIDLTKECNKMLWAVKSYVENASSCTKDEDCVAMVGECPFGCELYVYGYAKPNIEKKISAFRELCTTCARQCAMPSLKPVCREGRCVGDTAEPTKIEGK